MLMAAAAPEDLKPRGPDEGIIKFSMGAKSPRQLLLLQ